ncbi:MAG: DUF2474 family protein [Novosphingobium sp.]
MSQRARQFGWFALIWASSVLSLALVSLLIRAVLRT